MAATAERITERDEATEPTTMSTTKYRPEIAFPAELAQEDRHFVSGINSPGEVRGLNSHIGITATEIRTGLLESLEAIAGSATELFVDSGAFGESKFNPELGRFEIVKLITDAEWMRRFEIYEWAARTFRTRATIVAPDCVGNQALTLERLERYAVNIAVIAAHRANVIIPVQKGELSMSKMFARACLILGLRVTPIAGVPMKKDATSLEDLAELVGSLPWYGARIHLLGIGPKSDRYGAVIACIRSLRPNASITSDSADVCRLVGRTNRGKPYVRPMTRYSDEARALGIRGPDVKAYALSKHSGDERERQLDRAHAAGWFDTELYDSLEEAVAHRAAGYP